MKPRTLSALTAVALASSGWAHDDGLTCHTHPSSRFLMAQLNELENAQSGGLEYRPETGELAIAAIDASGRATWQVSSLPAINADSIRTDDVNGDGVIDIILTSREQNLVMAVGVAQGIAKPIGGLVKSVGPGMLGAEPVQRDGTFGSLLVPRVGWELSRPGAVSEASLFNLHTGEFLASAPLDAETLRAPLYTTASASPSGDETNWYAVTWAGAHSAQTCNSGIVPSVEFFTISSDENSSATPVSFQRMTLERGPTFSMGARFTGYDQNPWFAFSNPQDPIVEVVQPGRPESILHTFPSPVVSIRPIDLADREGALILFDDGNHGVHAGIYEFNPTDGFSLREAIELANGAAIADLIVLGDGRIFARHAGANAPGELSYSVYSNEGDGYILQYNATDLVFSAYPAVTTVKLYTDDPFGNGGAEFENLPAGHWATNASYDGTNIDATRELFEGTAAGLGSPAPVQLTPTGDPGPGGKAIANQWGDASSSLFFAGPSVAGPAPAVAISPPAGTYTTTIKVGFKANPGTTVVYRQTGGAWQPAPAGGFFVAADTTVEFYGQAADGTFTPIQSATYDIDQSLTTSPNGDWIPPNLALAFGIEPGDGPDIDGDGHSNLAELLAGTNHLSPDSFPPNDDWEFPPPLEITIGATLPAADGSVQPVPAGSVATVMTLAGDLLGRSTLDEHGSGKVSFTDYHFETPSSSGQRGGLGEYDRFSPLLLNVAVAGPTPTEMLGFVPICPFPAPPAFEDHSDPARWIDDARASYQWIRENCRQYNEEVNPLTTLATLAATSWARKYLDDAAQVKVRFPWDRSARDSIPLRPDHLELIGAPRGPSLDAFRLDEVATAMRGTLETDVAMEELVLLTEQIYLEAQRERKTRGPLQVLLGFTANGAVDPEYDTSGLDLDGATITYTGLESDPDPRPIRDITGTLLSSPRGWIVQSAIGERFALLGSAPILDLADGSVRLTRTAYRPTISALAGSTVRIVGFPLDQGLAPRKDGEIDLEVASFEFVEADLNMGMIDSDGDEVEDGFEQLFLGTLDYGFWDDPDGDLFSLGEEFLAGSDPSNPLSTPGGTPATPSDITLTMSPDGTITVSWTGSSTANYTVEISQSLGGWQSSPVAPQEVTPGEFEWTLPAPNPFPSRNFFRVATTID